MNENERKYPWNSCLSLTKNEEELRLSGCKPMIDFLHGKITYGQLLGSRVTIISGTGYNGEDLSGETFDTMMLSKTKGGVFGNSKVLMRRVKFAEEYELPELTQRDKDEIEKMNQRWDCWNNLFKKALNSGV